MVSAPPVRLARLSSIRATRPAAGHVLLSARVQPAAAISQTAADVRGVRCRHVQSRICGRAWSALQARTKSHLDRRRAPPARRTLGTSRRHRQATCVCVTRGSLAKRARRAMRASTRRRRAQTRARRVQRAQSRWQAVTALRTACVLPATRSSCMIRRQKRWCATRVPWASTSRSQTTLRACRARTIRPQSRQDLQILATVSATQATNHRRRNAPHVLPEHTKQTGTT